MNLLSFESVVLSKAEQITSNIKFLSCSSYTESGVKFAHFSYRNHLSIKLDPFLLRAFKDIENEIGIYDNVLSRFITCMNEGDFIDWTNKPSERKPISNLFLFAVTRGEIEFETYGKITLEAGQGIVFCPTLRYRVEPVTQKQIGIVWVLPHWLNL